MKTFTRRRTLDELKQAITARGWTLDTRLFDALESDYVTFHFAIGAVTGLCLVSTFNGRFFGALDSEAGHFDSDEPRDNEEWFATLLHIVYTH